MKKFEYITEVIEGGLGEVASKCNALGELGWQLVTRVEFLFRGRPCQGLIFMREKQEGMPYEELVEDAAYVVIPQLSPQVTVEAVIVSKDEVPVAVVETAAQAPKLAEDTFEDLYEEGWVQERNGSWADPLATDEELIKPPFGHFTADGARAKIKERSVRAD